MGINGWWMVGTAALSFANVTLALAETPDQPFAPIEAEQFLIASSTASTVASDVTGVVIKKDLRAESGPDYVWVELKNSDDA